MDRTLVLYVNPSAQQQRVLLATMQLYTSCFNSVALEGYNSGCSNGVELHKRTYYPLRAQYPSLPAQLVVSSRMKAAEAVKSALSLKRKGRKTRAPRAGGTDTNGGHSGHSGHGGGLCPIRYDMRSFWLRWDIPRAAGAAGAAGADNTANVSGTNGANGANGARGVSSLATVAGRVELDFVVPSFALKYIGVRSNGGSSGGSSGGSGRLLGESGENGESGESGESGENGESKVASAELVYKRGRWRLHVVVGLPQRDVAPNNSVVGVDLGVVRPAVTSTNHFFGHRRWREQEARIFRLRRKLAAKGTKSAKRHLRKLSGKLLRQRRDHDHVLSRRIVNCTPEGGTIVLEDLRGIRGRVKQRRGEQSRRMHSWSFAQLQRFTRYKGEERGQRVVLVNPHHTSQRCSREGCGHTSKANRAGQSVFRCKECGYQLNADLNAARNVAARYESQRDQRDDQERRDDQEGLQQPKQAKGTREEQARSGRTAAGGSMSSGLMCQSAWLPGPSQVD